MINRAETAMVEPQAESIAHVREDCKGLKNSPDRLGLRSEPFRGIGLRWPTAQEQVNLLTNAMFVERGHPALIKKQISTWPVQ